MAKFRLTAKAKDDLKKMATYTFYNWGIEQRNLYLAQMDDCFINIANNPDIGKKCDDIKAGYLKFPHGSHLLFYKRESVNTISIIRILHKSMDVESKF